MHLLKALHLDDPHDVLAIYIGDDRTDEDAFRELAALHIGFGILVSSKVGDPLLCAFVSAFSFVRFRPYVFDVLMLSFLVIRMLVYGIVQAACQHTSPPPNRSNPLWRAIPCRTLQPLCVF